MKEIEVSCAIIQRRGLLLIAQRNPGDSYGGFWEFPGGKRDDGESMEACLRREVHEELGIWVEPREFYGKARYLYPDRVVLLHFYFCEWVSGEAVCHDCHAFRWIRPEEMPGFRFLPGDIEVIRDLIVRRAYYWGVNRIFRRKPGLS